MADEQGNLLNELDEAFAIGDDDLLYIVRYPYSPLTSLKCKISTLKSFIQLTVGAGDMVGPDSSSIGNVVLFADTSGRLTEDADINIAGLLSRTNHTGQQPFSSLNALPTTLAGYGITDGGGKITLKDNGTNVSTSLASLNIVGATITHTGDAVTITIASPTTSAPVGAKYITQTPDGTLTAEQALSLLGTGILKNTTTTGVLSIAVPGTDYIPVPGSPAQGDLIYYDVTGNWVRFPKGSAGAFLKSTGSSIAYGALDPTGLFALTDATSIAVDATKFIPGSIGEVVITANRTLANPTGAIDGQQLTFRIRQNATGGFTLSLDTKYRFSDAVPSLTVNATPHKTTYLTVRYDGTDDMFDVIQTAQPA
jgi:hypothetical protein